MPLVTIIIPVYNTEKYLKKCLDSVVNQSYKNIEIIAINDASTDHSLHILKSYACTHKNVKILNNTCNLGTGASRNKGLDQATGDYIFFLDSDDEITYNAIERLIELSLTYNSPLVEASNKIVFNQNNIKIDNKPVAIKQIDIEKNKEYLFSKSGSACNKLYAHSLIEKERFPKGLIFEDAAFIYPVLTKTKKPFVLKRYYISITETKIALLYKIKLPQTKKYLTFILSAN